MSTGSHAGRVALVTGASSGIGALFAAELAGRGAKVVLAARRQDKLSDLVDRIKAAGGQAHAVSMDVREEASVIAAYDQAEAAFGLVDTVVANAGVNVESAAVKLSIEQFDAIHAVNSRGVFLTVREGGKRLIKAGKEHSARGRVVVLASMGGVQPLPYLVAYCGSKAAAVMMARGFAKEWVRFGICVNALCPGYMLTDINREWFESDPGLEMIEELPRSRLMPEGAILPMMVQLTSDDSAYTTGGVFQIDDGQLL